MMRVMATRFMSRVFSKLNKNYYIIKIWDWNYITCFMFKYFYFLMTLDKMKMVGPKLILIWKILR